MTMSALSELLRSADRGSWPAETDDAAWRTLAAWAFQHECLLADEAEDRAWEERTRALVKLGLPHDAFVETRTQALDERLRARKLAQSNLRYRYGFKPRRQALVRQDIRRFHAALCANEG